MARYTIDFSTNASAIVKELDTIIAKVGTINKVGQQITLDIDTSGLSRGIDETFKQLNRQIEKSQKALNKLQIGGPGFLKVAETLGTRQGRQERGRLIAEPVQLRAQGQAFEEGSLVRLSKEIQALQIEASQIKPNSQEWLGFQQQIGRIQAELKKADQTAEAIQLRDSLGAFNPGSLNQLSAKLQLLRIEANAISPDTTRWKQLNQEIQKTEGGIAKVNKKPLTAGQRAGAAGGAFLYGGGLGGGAGSAIGGIAGGLAGGVPGAFTGAAIGQAVDNLIQMAAAAAKTVAEVNKARISLAGVTRNVADYDNALAAATGASNKFLLPIVDSTRQFTRLQASVAGAGYETSTTTKVFNGIAAAIVATGGTTEGLNSALLATSQVFSKGKVTAEELRGQIGERLPGAFSIFAQSINKTPQQLDKALQDGSVTLKDFIKFSEELFKRYGTTAEILAKAPENAGLRLAVALQNAQVSYLGYFQVIGAGFQNQVTEVLRFATENEAAIKRVVTVFAIGFKTIGGLVEIFTKFLATAFNNVFTYLLGNLDTVLGRIEDAINRATAASSLTEKQIQNFQNAANKATAQKYGVKVAGINTGVIADQEGASQYYNKYFNKLVDTATKSAGRKKYTQAMQESLFPGFKPSSFGAGLGAAGANGDGTDTGNKKSENDKLKQFTNDRIAILQERLKYEQESINANTDLNERQKNIASARIEYELNNQIIDEQLAVARRESLSYQIEDRKKYIASQEQIAALRRGTLTKVFQGSVSGGLVKENQSLQDTYAELSATLDLLKAGKTGLTAADKAEITIAKETGDLKEDEIALNESLIAGYRALAVEIDKVTSATEHQKALIALQNQLKLAQIIDPRAERRAQIGQENKGFTPEQIESQASLEEQVAAAAKARDQLRSIASSIGDSFGEAFKGIITGTSTVQQAFANLFQSVADSFADMVAKMIAEWLRTQLLQGFQSIFSALIPGIGGAVAGAAGGSLSGAFGAGGPTFNPGAFSMPSLIGSANGNVLAGGFQAFADGGIVSGPTLGLVGEGRYNEAVIPMPNGKSVPVDLGGAMGGDITSNIVVNVNNGQAQSNGTGGNASDFGRKMEGAVKQVIVNELRPGGVLARR